MKIRIQLILLLFVSSVVFSEIRYIDEIFEEVLITEYVMGGNFLLLGL